MVSMTFPEEENVINLWSLKEENEKDKETILKEALKKVKNSMILTLMSCLHLGLSTWKQKIKN